MAENERRAYVRLGIGFAALAAIFAGGLLFATWDRSSPPPTVTEGQARDVLKEAVAWAQTGNIEQLCTAHRADTNMCRSAVFRLGGALGVPKLYPQIIGSGPIGDGQGWKLTVCGVDGMDHPYRSDFVVYAGDEDELRVPYPVYWSGVQVGEVTPGVTATSAAGPSEVPDGRCG
jgi:hypothetical protein